MTRTLLILLLLPSLASAQTTAVRFGQLWDGDRIVADAVVVVDGDRIAAVGSGDAAVPQGARVVDLRRYVGLPGLIDLHTHITYYWDRQPGTRPLGQRRPVAETVFLAQENAQKTLESGVTTARDLGSGGGADLAMRNLIARGAMTGPRLFVAGQGLSGDPSKPVDLEARRQQVADRVKAGVDWIKVYASRGSYDSVDTTQTMGFDEMKAIVGAAHAQGLKVAIHSYGASGVKDAVRAGADSVEHGVDLDEETLAEMKRRGTVWVPTIDHNRYYIDARDEFGFPDEALAPLRDYIARNLESTRRAVAAGVKVGMGSDAVYTMFGQNPRELEWLVKAGMTPEQALGAATTTGAALLGMGDRLGAVKPGYLADIIAVEGDPLRDVTSIFSGVRWVMKGGAVVVNHAAGPAGRVVDLGHPLASTDPSWEGDQVFHRTGTDNGEYKGGTFSSDEHFGTHLDAPAHFGGAWTVDQIPVDRLVRPGVAIQVAVKGDDYQVTVDDVKAFERAHGAIAEGSIVLFATGWDTRWPDRARYMNERGGVKHFPGISAAAAAYLAKDRKVSGIGIDTASVDYGPSESFETHRTTMPLNVFHIENAAHLTSLPPTGFTVVVAPINLVGGSGGPTRIYALLGGQ